MVSFTVFKGSKDGKIVQSSSSREIGNDEVLVKITHSGVCGTDIHFLHADMALGHEGAGVVEVSKENQLFEQRSTARRHEHLLKYKKPNRKSARTSRS